MHLLSEALRYEMLFLTVGLIALVTYRLLNGSINTNGLLLDKASGRAFSPGRLQLLVVTLGFALYYLLQVFDAEEPGTFPDLPNEFLLALGGSHVFYLGGKFYGMIASRLGFASPHISRRAGRNLKGRTKR